jgi:hypothetical protein
LTCLIASSLAGIPLGKSERKSPSRLTPFRPVETLLVRVTVARLGAVVVFRRLVAVSVRPAVFRFDAAADFRREAAVLARARVAVVELPATPCACFRCAPSAAARVKVRPHSGQVKPAERFAVGFRWRGLINASYTG